MFQKILTYIITNIIKKVAKSAILELETEKGVLKGHKVYSDYINNDVANLLENKFEYNDNSKSILSKEIEEVFMDEDNEK